MTNNNLTPEKGTEEDDAKIKSLKENPGEGGDPKDKSQEPEQSEDYQKKFGESSRENQILVDKLRIADEKLGKIARNEIPAEEELKKIYPDWDDMGDLEKGLAKTNLVLKRRVGSVEQEVSGMKEDKQWEADLDGFLTRANLVGEYSEISKREAEFKKFAKMPTHKGASFDVLAKAFLFKGKEAPVIVKKGSVLERGSGGDKIVTPKKKMTPDELKEIRLNDSKRYKKIITEHPDWIPTEIE